MSEAATVEQSDERVFYSRVTIDPSVIDPAQPGFEQALDLTLEGAVRDLRAGILAELRPGE